MHLWPIVSVCYQNPDLRGQVVVTHHITNRPHALSVKLRASDAIMYTRYFFWNDLWMFRSVRGRSKTTWTWWGRWSIKCPFLSTFRVKNVHEEVLRGQKRSKLCPRGYWMTPLQIALRGLLWQMVHLILPGKLICTERANRGFEFFILLFPVFLAKWNTL